MSVEAPSLEDFDAGDFVANLAALLGIDPTRIRVADVRPSVEKLEVLIFLRSTISVVDCHMNESPSRSQRNLATFQRKQFNISVVIFFFQHRCGRHGASQAAASWDSTCR